MNKTIEAHKSMTGELTTCDETQMEQRKIVPSVETVGQFKKKICFTAV